MKKIIFARYHKAFTIKSLMVLLFILSVFILVSCGSDSTDPIGGGGQVFDEATVGPPHNQSYYKNETLFKTSNNPRYRIPAIKALSDGNTIIALGDNRYGHGSDIGVGGARVDIMVRKSTNRGATWSDAKIVGKQSTDHKDSRGDPVLFEAANGDVVILAAGGGGWFTGGNEETPSLIWMSRSKDKGDTWSTWKQVQKPIFDHLASAEGGNGVQVKGFIGSGRGYTDTKGGTLRAAMLIGNADGGDRAALSIYSDDNGETWKAGGKALTSAGSVDEPKIVGRLSDDRLLMSIRNPGSAYRSWSYSPDDGATWTVGVNTPQIRDPACNAEGIIYTYRDGNGDLLDDKTRLLHVNCNAVDRANLTVFISYDEMKTVEKLKTLQPGTAGYSSIDVLKDGTIIVLGEENFGNGYDLVFRAFNLYWLTNGKDYPGKK